MSPRPAEWDCDGTTVCLAELHVHGCLSDDGQCDDPTSSHYGQLSW